MTRVFEDYFDNKPIDIQGVPENANSGYSYYMFSTGYYQSC